MSNDVILTPEGYAKLSEELQFLKSVERPRIADNIREAKSHGDLRENAMYHEAKLNQKRLESRISELERVLQVARVVERQVGDEGAGLGSRVLVRDVEWNEEMTIELVGAFESDPVENKISVDSPLGRALMGATAGNEIEVTTPNGTQVYAVLEVHAPA